jgi:hypothetical protein
MATMTTPPDDADLVLTAIRLGWYVAEVRGRNRLDGPTPCDSSPPVRQRGDFDLPLRLERSWTELRIEAQTVMYELAKKLARANLGNDTRTVTQTRRIEILCRCLWRAHKRSNEPSQKSTWGLLSKDLFAFDKGIQDLLTSFSDTQACGYQLGRGLAEAYWELDLGLTTPAAVPQDAPQLGRIARWFAERKARKDQAEAFKAQEAVPPQTWHEWTFLLGESRSFELSRLVGRLSAYFNLYTAPAVAGSLSAWEEVASNPAWRTVAKRPPRVTKKHWWTPWRKDPDPDEADPVGAHDYVRDVCLYRQIRRWYELVVLLQDPSTLIKPYAILRNFRAIWKALRGFALQILAGALSLGFIAGYFWVASSDHPHGWQKSLLAFLSIVGLTGTTVSATLKNTAQALVSRIKTDAYGDLVGLQITTTPPPPATPFETSGFDRTRRDRTTVRAVQRRRITSVNQSPN